MLWPSPAQRPRIAEIRDNLTARIAEADGLKISLADAEDKLPQIGRRSLPAGPVAIGMPAFGRVCEAHRRNQPGTRGPAMTRTLAQLNAAAARSPTACMPGSPPPNS